MKRILFVVLLDKFTHGFYRFIQTHFPDMENWFIFYGGQNQFKFDEDNERIFWLDSYRSLPKTHRIVDVAKNCNMIIYSGLFGSHGLVKVFGFNTLSKTFFHFWGDDFYMYRNFKKYPLKMKLRLLDKRFLINHAYGVINLIPNDYIELCKLCNPKGKHFIAPMCDAGEETVILESLVSKEKTKSPIKILLGNSATETNQHCQALDILNKFKNEDIVIICPLSYGDGTYRNKVLEYGKECFGQKFLPIVDFLEKKEYFTIISDCSIAVFNNNRQQAMGNINAALSLGCKVFIRNDTAMWDNYKIDKKMEIYDINSISDMTFEEFIHVMPSQSDNYIKIHNYYGTDNNKKAWQRVFDSIE